jgi:hypothetical protein
MPLPGVQVVIAAVEGILAVIVIGQELLFA